MEYMMLRDRDLHPGLKVLLLTGFHQGMDYPIIPFHEEKGCSHYSL